MPKRYLTVLLLLLAACDPRTGPADAYFLATLNGAVEGDYAGSGSFAAGTLPSGRATVALASMGSGSSTGETFTFRVYGSRQIPVGTHALVLVADRDAQSSGVSAMYARQATAYESFTADAGEVTVTRSTPDRVEGHFRFSGFRYCAQTEENPANCTIPASAPAAAPRIEVTGSFSAAPMSRDVELGLP